MKQEYLIREILNAGCHMRHRGWKHEIYTNPATGRNATIPLHSEIASGLCKVIQRHLGLPALK
jgi:mRNA interferase HicA